MGEQQSLYIEVLSDYRDFPSSLMTLDQSIAPVRKRS